MKTRLIALLILISMLFLYSCESGNLDSDNTNGNNSSENGGSESPDESGGNENPDGSGSGDTGSGSGDSESPDNNDDPDEDEAPDYGTATVYEKGSTVYLVGEAEERSLISAFVGALGEQDINVTAGDGAEKKNEIIVGKADGRAIASKAYSILEKMPKKSYFMARYLVYASSGKIAIAYDFNEYTPLSALECMTDELCWAIIDADGFVALPEGVIAQGSIDLIAEQKKLDEKALDVAWAKLEKKVPAEIYEAFRTLYTLYDDELISWYANLYDPNVGAYYSTTSQKEKECYFPGPEVTIQALRFLESSGMLSGLGKYRDNIPKIMKYSIIYYCKSIQDPNGYFYDPQYEKHSASGRDLSWCTDMLRLFESAPVYDTPNGYKGDGISADEYWDNLVLEGVVDESTPRPLNLVKLKEANSQGKLTSSLDATPSEAVSKIMLTATTMDYLSDYRTYIDYLNDIDVDNDPYGGCGILNSTYNQVKTQSDVLYNKQGAFVYDESYGEKYRMYDGMNLKEITIAYYSSKINPETGMCGQPSSLGPTGREYRFTNGFFKIIPVYTNFGAAYPYAEEAAETLLMAIVSDEPTKQNICDVYNVWSGLYDLKNNVNKYGSAEAKATVIPMINDGVLEKGAEAILKSYEKMKGYKMPDGGFASSTKHIESNVDAIGKPLNGMVAPMYALLGAEKVQMYTRHHWMEYLEILLSLERNDKVYFKPLSEILTFEDMPGTSQLFLRSATAELSIQPGKDGDPALLINKNVNKDQSIVDIPLMQKVADPKVLIFETDIKIANVQKSNPIALAFGPRGGTHSNRTYRYQFDTSTVDGTSITMKEMQWSGSGSSYDTINSFKTSAKIGEWFNLRIEYDTTYLAAKGYPETRVYVNDELVFTTNEVYSVAIEADDTSAAATFIMYTPLLCELWLDNTSVRQAN